MRKSDSLRAAVVAAFPALEAQAQQLKVWLDQGRVVSQRRPGGGVAMEYRYRCSLLLIDFSGDADLLFATIVLWLAIEQPSIGQQVGGRDAGIAFQVDVLDDGRVDVLVELDLVEAVERQGGVFVHLAERQLDDDDIIGGDLVRVDGRPALVP